MSFHASCLPRVRRQGFFARQLKFDQRFRRHGRYHRRLNDDLPFAKSAVGENAILARRTLCLGRLSARERVAHLLCELAVRLGVDDAAGPVSFEMPLTQEHLADVLGLTPVHVNRTMQRLRADDVLTSTTRKIAIGDIAALRRIGEFQPRYLRAPGDDGVAGIINGRRSAYR